jgi:hypothetical protein
MINIVFLTYGRSDNGLVSHFVYSVYISYLTTLNTTLRCMIQLDSIAHDTQIIFL